MPLPPLTVTAGSCQTAKAYQDGCSDASSQEEGKQETTATSCPSPAPARERPLAPPQGNSGWEVQGGHSGLYNVLGGGVAEQLQTDRKPVAFVLIENEAKLQPKSPTAFRTI